MSFQHCVLFFCLKYFLVPDLVSAHKTLKLMLNFMHDFHAEITHVSFSMVFRKTDHDLMKCQRLIQRLMTLTLIWVPGACLKWLHSWTVLTHEF